MFLATAGLHMAFSLSCIMVKPFINVFTAIISATLLKSFSSFFESVGLWTSFFSELKVTGYQGSCIKACFSVSKMQVGIELLIAKETRALQPQGNLYII